LHGSETETADRQVAAQIERAGLLGWEKLRAHGSRPSGQGKECGIPD
jgi:hypothetical protein